MLQAQEKSISRRMAASGWTACCAPTPSEGVHDALYAHALVLCEGSDVKQAFTLVSVDVCVLDNTTCSAVRQGAKARTGIPASHMISSRLRRHPIRGPQPDWGS